MTVLIDLGSNSTLFREGASVLSAKFLPFARLDVSQSLFQLHKKHSGKFCSKPCFQASQKKPANSRLMLSWVELPLRRHWLCWRRPWHFFNTHDQTQLQKPAIYRQQYVGGSVCIQESPLRGPIQHYRRQKTRTAWLAKQRSHQCQTPSCYQSLTWLRHEAAKAMLLNVELYVCQGNKYSLR
jgi:hypothetical protein